MNAVATMNTINSINTTVYLYICLFFYMSFLNLCPSSIYVLPQFMSFLKSVCLSVPPQFLSFLNFLSFLKSVCLSVLSQFLSFLNLCPSLIYVIPQKCQHNLYLSVCVSICPSSISLNFCFSVN